jgi:hypothetical protein
MAEVAAAPRSPEAEEAPQIIADADLLAKAVVAKRQEVWAEAHKALGGHPPPGDAQPNNPKRE